MKNFKGFTLIELLVVISIIGVISSVIFMSFSGQRDKARLAKAQQFDAQISHALGAYAVGIWRFESISGGKVFDESGYGNDGTIHGNPILVDSEVYPGTKALKFDGNDYVSIPANSIPSGNQITFSLWAYGANIQPTQNSVIEARSADNLRTLNVHLPWSNGNIYFDCGNNGSTYDRINKSASAVDYKGKWTHWVFTKNAVTGDMKIYLNGKLWHSGTGKTRSLPATTAVKLGSYVDGSHCYPGIIDDVRIYDEALSSAQIQQHYVAGAPAHGIAIKQ